MRTYIFDLDGTLADTIGIHHIIEMFLLEEHLKKEHIKYDKDEVEKIMYETAYQVDNAKRIAIALSEKLHFSLNASKWTDTKNELVFNAIKSKNVQVYPKLLNIIKNLHKQGNNLVLLTSGERPLVKNLMKFWKLEKYFPDDKIITTYDKKSVYQLLGNTKSAFHQLVIYEDNLKYLNFCKEHKITCYQCNHGKVNLYYDNVKLIMNKALCEHHYGSHHRSRNTLEVLGCEESL